MKNTSRTMFNIGNIYNICSIVLGAILIGLGILLIIVGNLPDVNKPEVVGFGGSCLGSGIYLLVTAILCFVFVGKAQRELADESTSNVTPFIVTIVFGAISFNPLYVLAGIFGLIADKQQGQEQGDSFDQPAEDKQPE